MTVNIVGWYGTETIGDIAILDGILSVFSGIDDNNEYRLGSLFPFYTNRNIFLNRETAEVLSEWSHIKVYDLKQKSDVDNNINESDIVVFGGGPLMDIAEITIMRYCFEKANKAGIPTIVMGCGVGSLHDDYCIDETRKIFRNADLILLRDSNSLRECKRIGLPTDGIRGMADPAIISISNYMSKCPERKRDKETAAINFRSIAVNEYKTNGALLNENLLTEIMKVLRDRYKKIYLVPMHTFYFGGDDRSYLYRIKKKCGEVNDDHMKLMNKPVCLWQIYKTFQKAYFCVGMRYHSCVMQTLINGNNYIINYTRFSGGKIDGFIEGLGDDADFHERVWNTDEEFPMRIFKDLASNREADVSVKYLDKYNSLRMDYIDSVREIL